MWPLNLVGASGYIKCFEEPDVAWWWYVEDWWWEGVVGVVSSTVIWELSLMCLSAWNVVPATGRSFKSLLGQWRDFRSGRGLAGTELRFRSSDENALRELMLRVARIKSLQIRSDRCWCLLWVGASTKLIEDRQFCSVPVLVVNCDYFANCVRMFVENP